MIFGLSLHAYTQLHVLISLIAIGSGLAVMYGLLIRKRLDGLTSLFMATTALTSVTGFGFPFVGVTPAIKLGDHFDGGSRDRLSGAICEAFGRGLARNLRDYSGDRALFERFCVGGAVF